MPPYSDPFARAEQRIDERVAVVVTGRRVDHQSRPACRRSAGRRPRTRSRARYPVPGRGRARRGSGTSSRTSVPAGTTALARTGTPSTVRRPSEMSFWTWLRERPVASATNRSIRPVGPVGDPDASGRPTRPGPQASAGPAVLARRPSRLDASLVTGASPDRTAFGSDCVATNALRQQDDREADRGIGDVERVRSGDRRCRHRRSRRHSRSGTGRPCCPSAPPSSSPSATDSSVFRPELWWNQMIAPTTPTETTAKNSAWSRKSPNSRAVVMRVDQADVVTDDLEPLAGGQRGRPATPS